MIFQFLKKQKDAIFFSVEYHVYWLLKSVCFEIFGDRKYGLFFSQKVDAKMIFTDYWKVLVLNFSEMENTVFYWTKRLMGRWYLLGLFELSMIFQALENIFFCAVRGANSQVVSKWFFLDKKFVTSIALVYRARFRTAFASSSNHPVCVCHRFCKITVNSVHSSIDRFVDNVQRPKQLFLFDLEQLLNNIKSAETLLNTGWEIFSDNILLNSLLDQVAKVFLELVHPQE